MYLLASPFSPNEEQDASDIANLHKKHANNAVV